MTQTPNSRLKLMTQERIFSIIINQTRTNKSWMVSHDMMQMHEGIPLELNPMLKLLETRWWGIHTTCLVSLSNDRSGFVCARDHGITGPRGFFVSKRWWQQFYNSNPNNNGMLLTIERRIIIIWRTLFLYQ